MLKKKVKVQKWEAESNLLMKLWRTEKDEESRHFNSAPRQNSVCNANSSIGSGDQNIPRAHSWKSLTSGNVNLPNWMSPWRPPVCCPLRNHYLIFIVLQPRCNMLLMVPPTDRLALTYFHPPPDLISLIELNLCCFFIWVTVKREKKKLSWWKPCRQSEAVISQCRHTVKSLLVGFPCEGVSFLQGFPSSLHTRALTCTVTHLSRIWLRLCPKTVGIGPSITASSECSRVCAERKQMDGNKTRQ